MFDEEFAGLPGPGLLLAAGDNVGASPPNSGLLQDRPAIDVENLWGLDATSLGNHEFDYGVARLLEHIRSRELPVPGDERRRERRRATLPDWLEPSKVFTVNGIQVGVIGAELESTPELVSAGATAGLTFLPEAPADQGRVPAPEGARRQRPGRRHPPGHGVRPERHRQRPRRAVGGPDPRDRGRAPGHDRRRDDRRPHPPGLQPDARQHPHHRGDQRRHELLGPAADGPGRRRRLGRRRDARRRQTSASPAGRTSRPSSPQRTPPSSRSCPRSSAPRGATSSAIRTRRNESGDGQPRRGRDARQVPRGGGGVHELGRPPGRPPVRPAERRRGLVRHHPRRAVRASCRSATRPSVDDAHRGPDEGRVRERLLGRSATRPSTPDGSRRSRGSGPRSTATGRASSSTASGRRPRASPRSRSRTATPSGSSPTTSCTPAATATPSSRPAPT